MSHTTAVRVRYAPSPTGFMHIGNARAALFNFLYARHKNGVFLVRVEDTDLERSTAEATQHILDSMKWLGMWPDEPIEYQSKRADRHQAYLQRLLDSGDAYMDYCSKERLEQLREEAKTSGGTFVYRRSLIGDAEMKKFCDAGEPGVIRFRVPEEGATAFDDLVYGRIEVQNSTIGDFVIARGDGSPLYNFTNAVDDIDMKITHVCRGEDHVTNTTRQLQIYRALGTPTPQFAHLPMILGPDKQKLSKRHGAVGVMQFREMGILPQALVNFIALLGWAPSESEFEEVMTMEELCARFSLEKVNKSPAVFDYEKLFWMNGRYIRERVKREDLYDTVIPRLGEKMGFSSDPKLVHQHTGLPNDIWLRGIIDLQVERSRTLNDFADGLEYFFHPPAAYDEKAGRKFLSDPEKIDLLRQTGEEIDRVLEAAGIGVTREDASDSYSVPLPGPALHEFLQKLESQIRTWAEGRGVKLGNVLQPIRLALTGRTNSPPLFDVIYFLGREETRRRIVVAVQHFTSLLTRH